MQKMPRKECCLSLVRVVSIDAEEIVLSDKYISHSVAKRMKIFHRRSFNSTLQLMVCVGQSPLQQMRYSIWSIAFLLPLVLAPPPTTTTTTPTTTTTAGGTKKAK